jgi:hypothetical protein
MTTLASEQVSPRATPGVVVGAGALVQPGGEQGASGIATWSGLCGRLGVASSPSNTISFVPYNGNLIKIAGSIRYIPSAGVSAVANNLYLNGVAGSSLAANTLYNVYAFDNSGTLTLDFSTTTHVTSSTAGNVGVEIKSGNDTRSFVGLVQTSSTAPGSNSFRDEPDVRLIASWFNRPPISFNSYGNATLGALSLKVAFYMVLFKGDSLTSTATFYGTGSGVTNFWLRLYDGMSGSYNEASASSPHSTSEFINIFVSAGAEASTDIYFANSLSGYSQNSGMSAGGNISMITNIQYAVG